MTRKSVPEGALNLNPPNIEFSSAPARSHLTTVSTYLTPTLNERAEGVCCNDLLDCFHPKNDFLAVSVPRFPLSFSAPTPSTHVVFAPAPCTPSHQGAGAAGPFLFSAPNQSTQYPVCRNSAAAGFTSLQTRARFPPNARSHAAAERAPSVRPRD